MAISNVSSTRLGAWPNRTLYAPPFLPPFAYRHAVRQEGNYPFVLGELRLFVRRFSGVPHSQEAGGFLCAMTIGAASMIQCVRLRSAACFSLFTLLWTGILRLIGFSS